MIKPLWLANNFIMWGQEQGVDMTPLKLQKLIYLYYARYLYLWNAVPFSELFEKWPKGPVLRDVYEALKIFGGNNIPGTLTDIRGKVVSFTWDSEWFAPAFSDVASRFGRMSAHELIQLTHEGLPGGQHETAWRKAPDMGTFLDPRDAMEDGRVLFG
jgi:uncharacterized phage-associated protein